MTATASANKKGEIMANRVNNWKELQKLANEDLKKYDAEIGVYDHDDAYSVTIVVDGKEEEYADNYYEDELGDLINDAWAHVRAKIKGEKKIYYTATALYNNDENHSAESGVFSSEKRAMEWLEKQAKQWKEDQGIDDEDFELRIESRKVNAYDSGTCLYSFEGTVGEAYMDNPEGPFSDVLKRNQKIINKRKEA